MLNKISNIALGTENNSQRSNNSPEHTIRHSYFREKSVNNDSVNLSPAFQHIKKIGWELRSIKKVSNSKIVCIFKLHNFIFEASINLSLSNRIENIVYKINEDKIYGNKKIMGVFSLDLGSNSFKFEDMNSLHYLENVFRRFYLLNLENEFSKKDEVVLVGLLEDYNKGLLQEFDYINYNLLKFVEILLNMKLFVLKDNEPNSLKLIRIILE